MTRPELRPRWFTLLLVVALTTVTVGVPTLAGAGGGHVAPSLLPLHATRGVGAAIVDASDRQMTLRGVNVNSLGDYYQADPKLPTIVAVTRADWARMAAHGFNVVRLLVSWSALEPRPGHIDRQYLHRVRRTVDEAARYGIYSVIDMHQDAGGKYIASPPGTVCPAGSEPAIGWDGAPKWATITDGASTCARGSRENSDAVLTAWDSFYADRAGIMSHLVKVWTAVAHEFRRNPAVAGYDLLNEPNLGRDPNVLVNLATYFKRSLDAIRVGERGSRSLHHIVFFETTVVGSSVEPFSDDPNLVFEGHNYGESIGSIPIDAIFDYFQSLATKYGTALWIGEYGWFSDPVANQEKLGRFSAKEDALLTAGDAWWQWRQACGDPHSVGHPGGTPDAVLIHFQRNGCPGDHNLGVVREWACTWRPYPRAAPGRLTERNAACTRDASVAGTTTRPGTLELWYPGSVRPTVTGSGLSRVHTERVRGGWAVTAQVRGSYRVHADTPP